MSMSLMRVFRIEIAVRFVISAWFDLLRCSFCLLSLRSAIVAPHRERCWSLDFNMLVGRTKYTRRSRYIHATPASLNDQGVLEDKDYWRVEPQFQLILQPIFMASVPGCRHRSTLEEGARSPRFHMLTIRRLLIKSSADTSRTCPS